MHIVMCTLKKCPITVFNYRHKCLIVRSIVKMHATNDTTINNSLAVVFVYSVLSVLHVLVLVMIARHSLECGLYICIYFCFDFVHPFLLWSLVSQNMKNIVWVSIDEKNYRKLPESILAYIHKHKYISISLMYDIILIINTHSSTKYSEITWCRWKTERKNGAKKDRGHLFRCSHLLDFPLH